MVCVASGILFILEKEGRSATCCHMHEPGGRRAQRNKPVTKRQTLYDPISVKHPEYSNSQRQKVAWGLPVSGGRGLGHLVSWAQSFSFIRSKSSGDGQWGRLHNNMNVLNATKLYT